MGKDFLNGSSRDDRALAYESPDRLKSMVAQKLPKDGIGIEGILQEFSDLIAKYSIAQFDDGYLAFPDSGNALPAMAADIFSKFLNQNLIAFSRSAPIATFIEIQLIEWLRQLIGHEHKDLDAIESLADVSGMVTTGGHMANHIAVLTALNTAFPNIKTEGLTSLNEKPVIILAGDISHYSFVTAAHHLGLGRDSIVSVASTGDYRTDARNVEEVLANPPKDTRPFMAVGIAGNAKTTQIDDIEELADVCEQHNTWLHIDACHGGSLLFSKKYRSMLKGIERADSVSIDPHKGLFMAYPLSFILFKRRGDLVVYTRYEEEVRDGSSWDLGFITPFYGSRGFESLKLYSTIKCFGIDGLADIIDERQDLALKMADVLKDNENICMLNDVEFYRMSFVYLPRGIREDITSRQLSMQQRTDIRDLIEEYTHRINEELYVDGRLILDEFKLSDLNNSTKLNLDGKMTVMSATLGNPNQSTEKIGQSLQLLFDKCQAYRKEYQLRYRKIVTENARSTTNKTGSYGPAGW